MIKAIRKHASAPFYVSPKQFLAGAALPSPIFKMRGLSLTADHFDYVLPA